MTDESTTTPARPRWVFLLVGIGGGAVGLVPWLVTGARLPLQNVWDDVPASLPAVLLPFHPYFVTLLAALLPFGSAAAGVAARALGARRTRAAVGITIGGVLLVQLTAVVQTAIATVATMPDTTEAQIWVGGLTLGASASVSVGVAVCALIARAPRAGAVIGLTVGAIAAQSWTAALLAPPTTVSAADPAALFLVPWIAPVLTGIAIAWAGIGSAARIMAAVGAIALVWIMPAAITGLTNALGTRVYWSYPAELVRYAVGVFEAALLTPELALRPIAGVLLTAALGLGVRAAIRRRRGAAERPPR